MYFKRSTKGWFRNTTLFFFWIGWFIGDLISLCCGLPIAPLKWGMDILLITIGTLIMILSNYKLHWSTGHEFKFKYLFEALKYQGPLKRAFHNFFITGNAWGIFAAKACVKDGKPKVGRSTKEKALSMANEMAEKTGYYFSHYKCPRCGKWHIGKNRTSISEHLIDNEKSNL